MLTALMEKEGTEKEDKIETAALMLNMSQSKFLKYLDLNQQPVSSWKKKQQSQLALVEEYWERMTAMKDYDYPLEIA